MIIPNSVTTIRDATFESCRSLTSIIIPNSVTTIGENAFQYCSGLTSVIISNSVIMIGDGAFGYCNSLTSVIISNSVTMIGIYAFLNCSNLKHITCNAIIPPAIHEHTFILQDIFTGKITPIDAIVYVPCNSFNDYKTADYWSIFTDFRGMPDTTFVFDTVCQGKIYTNNGFFIDEGAGAYYRSETTANNCDSIIKLSLTVNPIYFVSDTVTIKEGETYIFNNKSLTETGIYYDTLQTIYGCDSIFELNLMYETSIVERQFQNIKIYPNPTNGQLRMDNGQWTISTIEIYDIMGKIIHTGLLRFSRNDGVELDLSHLENGIYLLKIKTEKGIISQKIVKY